MNAAPKPGSLSTQIEPPAESTLVRATASPKPASPFITSFSDYRRTTSLRVWLTPPAPPASRRRK